MALVTGVQAPIQPMLARLVRELPVGDYLYEPKWDGFRALVFREGDAVGIQSRHLRPMGRYFPELIDAIGRMASPRCILDGEIMVVRDGRFDFETLMLRTHPAASRVALLSSQAPAIFIAFDLLALGTEDLMETPFRERRAQLERALSPATGHVVLTPTTPDRSVAMAWLQRFTGNGIDGVVAKPGDLTYQPGRRAMFKIKLERTADCVVAGYRAFADDTIASLLLGLYDDSGVLRHVGVSSAFTELRRRELFDQLVVRTTALAGHPWERGFGLEQSPVGRLKGSAGRWEPGMTLDWTPISPLVAEVAYDTTDGRRFRHPAHFRRWRPDREPPSCTFDQLPDRAPHLNELLPDLAPTS